MMTLKRVIVILFIVALVFCMIAGCTITIGRDSDNDKAVKKLDTSKVSVYGNGIHYFPFVKEKFGKALNEYLIEHPNFEVVTMCGDGTGGYGYDVGYFVIFKNKESK